LSSSASNPSLCLLSRPHHNATAPSAKPSRAVAPSTSAISIGGHHVIAESIGGPQAHSSPLARQGRSEAEWLDRAEDRRQSRIVMAALLSDGGAQRENKPDERDAQGWETVGGDGAVPSQADIRWKCAFTYMNAVSRKDLTDARAVDANDVDTASETGGAFSDGRDRARFCRTAGTFIWSDPQRLGAGP
jgi:hypothetical protein